MPDTLPDEDDDSLLAPGHPAPRKAAYQRMQARFVRAFHETSPALPKSERGRLAAIQAGYSERTAHSAGIKLLSKPHILRAILEAHPRAKVETVGIDASWLLNELAELWEMDLAALFDPDTGELLPLASMPVQAQKLIAAFEVSTEVETVQGRRRVTTRLTKVKLIDRLQVLHKIGQTHMVSAFTSPEVRDAERSLSQLMRALTKAMPGSTTERDVTPTNGQPAPPRRLSDVLGSQDE